MKMAEGPALNEREPAWTNTGVERRSCNHEVTTGLGRQDKLNREKTRPKKQKPCWTKLLDEPGQLDTIN
jgi:hypothetical protein